MALNDPPVPVRASNTVEPGDKCQEASVLSVRFYIPCGAPAAEVVYSDRDRRAYYVCAPCADHCVRNRGMALVTGKAAA